MFWNYLFYFACTLPSFAWQLWLCFRATKKGRFATLWVLGAAAVICLLICWNPGDRINGHFLGNANLILAGFILLDMALFAIGVALGWVVFAIYKKRKNIKGYIPPVRGKVREEMTPAQYRMKILKLIPKAAVLAYLPSLLGLTWLIEQDLQMYLLTLLVLFVAFLPFLLAFIEIIQSIVRILEKRQVERLEKHLNVAAAVLAVAILLTLFYIEKLMPITFCLAFILIALWVAKASNVSKKTEKTPFFEKGAALWSTTAVIVLATLLCGVLIKQVIDSRHKMDNSVIIPNEPDTTVDDTEETTPDISALIASVEVGMTYAEKERKEIQ